MQAPTATRAAAAAIALALTVGGCGGEEPAEPDPPNRAPNTPSISSNNAFAALLPGEAVLLTASATDPDGDPLIFRWSLTASSGGTLADTVGTSNQWTAGPQPGADQIRVVATDGELRRASVPLTLFVGTAMADTVANGEVWRADSDPYVMTHPAGRLTTFTPPSRGRTRARGYVRRSPA